LSFDDLFHSTMHFYGLACRVFAHPSKNNTFSIGVVIPMMSRNTDFIYEYRNNRLALNTPSLELEIIPANKLVITDAKKSSFIELHSGELTKCSKIGNIYACPDLRISRKSNTCLNSLYKDRLADVFKYCEFGLRSRWGAQATQIMNDEFLITTDVLKAADVQCEGRTVSPRTVEIEPGYSTIKLPPGCAMLIDDIHIAAQSNSSSRDESYKHYFLEGNLDYIIAKLQDKFPEVDFSEQGLKKIQARLQKGSHSLSLEILNSQAAAANQGPVFLLQLLGSVVALLLLLLVGSLVLMLGPTAITEGIRYWRQFRNNKSANAEDLPIQRQRRGSQSSRGSRPGSPKTKCPLPISEGLAASLRELGKSQMILEERLEKELHGNSPASTSIGSPLMFSVDRLSSHKPTPPPKKHQKAPTRNINEMERGASRFQNSSDESSHMSVDESLLLPSQSTGTSTSGYTGSRPTYGFSFRSSESATDPPPEASSQTKWMPIPQPRQRE